MNKLKKNRKGGCKLEAIGKTVDGRTVSFAVQTAGEPATIKLSPDRKVLKANRQDLGYVSVQLLNANGVLVPFASNRKLNKFFM